MKNSHIKPGGVFDKMLSGITKPKPDDRLAILATELGIAGAQVLQEEPFNFTPKQTALWLDKMLDRARVNRGAELARQAVEAIDGKIQPR